MVAGLIIYNTYTVHFKMLVPSKLTIFALSFSSAY
jgi:hypothetical protein